VRIVAVQTIDGSRIDAEMGAGEGLVPGVVALGAQIMDRFRGQRGFTGGVSLMADQTFFLYCVMGYLAGHPLSQRFMTAEAKIVGAGQQQVIDGRLVGVVTACALTSPDRFVLNSSFAQCPVEVIVAHKAKRSLVV